MYRPQVEEQEKTLPKLVIIREKEEFEIEKILNKRVVRGKENFLVWWKRYTMEGNTWESRENLKNTKKLVKEFERKYREETKKVKWQKENDNKKMFSRKLLERFIAKIL